MPKSTRKLKKPSAGSAKVSDLARTATRALVKAQRIAAKENARFNLPLIVVKDGRIVGIPTSKEQK